MIKSPVFPLLNAAGGLADVVKIKIDPNLDDISI